jgi:hypothetical protein
MYQNLYLKNKFVDISIRKIIISLPLLLANPFFQIIFKTGVKIIFAYVFHFFFIFFFFCNLFVLLMLVLLLMLLIFSQIMIKIIFSVIHNFHWPINGKFWNSFFELVMLLLLWGKTNRWTFISHINCWGIFLFFSQVLFALLSIWRCTQNDKEYIESKKCAHLIQKLW